LQVASPVMLLVSCQNWEHQKQEITGLGLKIKVRAGAGDGVRIGVGYSGIVWCSYFWRSCFCHYPVYTWNATTLPALQWMTATLCSLDLSQQSTLWQNGSISSSRGGWWSSNGYDSTRP